MQLKRFYDTNAILELEKIEEPILLSSITLHEIEHIKTSRNKDEDVKYKARRAIKLIDGNNLVEVSIYDSDAKSVLEKLGLDETPDNMICATASKLKEEIIFISNDICCKVIAANAFGLNVESIKEPDDEYTGFKKIVLSDTEMAYLYEHQDINQFNLLTNQYALIINNNNEIVDKLRWDGNKFQPVKVGTIRSNYYGSVKAYNGDIYQQCVLDSLNNNQITMIKGPAGTGKSYLALGYLFHLLDKRKIEKIVMFVNPTPTANAAKLGFLPGSQTEKLIDSSVGNMLAGKLGDKYAIEELMSRRQLDILPMCDIRGFDTTGLNCGVYITEAQNLDISLMKLALQRIGEDSFCIVEGDYNAQVDLVQYAGSNNGMRRMSEVFRGQDFYGEVELQNIYRSRIAEIAERM